MKIGTPPVLANAALTASLQIWDTIDMDDLRSKSIELSERLILNHLIVVFNVFGIEAALNILDFKLEDKHWPVMKPFLIFLNYIENDQYTGITMDPEVVNVLRKI